CLSIHRRPLERRRRFSVLCLTSIHGHALHRRRHDPSEHIRQLRTSTRNQDPSPRSREGHRVHCSPSDERTFTGKEGLTHRHLRGRWWPPGGDSENTGNGGTSTPTP